MVANRTDTERNETRTDVPTRGSQPRAFRIVGAAALGVLAAGQLTNMTYGGVNADSGEPWVMEEHDLSNLRVTLEDSTVTRLGGEGPTLLLVFDPECPHSERIAASWARWLAGGHAKRMRVLIVSEGPLLAAVRYARAKEWSGGQLGTLESSGEGSLGQAVAKRSPWVFAVDHNGRVIAEGHGGTLAEVARLLE